MKSFLLCIITLLFFNISSAQDEIQQDWMSYYQYCDIKQHVGKKFRISAVIKKLKSDADAKAAIWVRIDDGNDGYTFFENNAAKNKITNKWQLFTTEGTIAETSEVLNFGVYCKLNGSFYFDDFKVQYLHTSGTWKDLPIGNAGFEKNEDIFASAWSHGTSTTVEKVKGYTVSYSDEQAFEGKRSLMIEGKGIILDDD